MEQAAAPVGPRGLGGKGNKQPRGQWPMRMSGGSGASELLGACTGDTNWHVASRTKYARRVLDFVGRVGNKNADHRSVAEVHICV